MGLNVSPYQTIINQTNIMKRIIFVIIATLFAGISLNAQVATDNSGLEFKGGSYYYNGKQLTTDQLADVLGMQKYGDDYIPAKKLRTAGIECLAVGGAVAALGTGLAIFSKRMEQRSTAAALNAGTAKTAGIIAGATGGAVAIAGAFMLSSGNKRLRALGVATSGGGLAFAF